VNRAPWTDEDLEVLRTNCHVPAAEIADRLGRTIQAIYSARYEYGWAYTGPRPSGDLYTPEDMALIRATAHLDPAEVGRMLGRRASAIRTMRSKMPGVTFGKQVSPHFVGRRALVAKTCEECGLLLDATWFRKTAGKDAPWDLRCLKCTYRRKNGMRYARQKKTGTTVQDKSFTKRLQAKSLETAIRRGQPWLESDVLVLSDPDLTHFEKAIRLNRTYYATMQEVQQRGLSSKTGLGDAVKGEWVIDNPNAPSAVAS
jgi:hypothetical protein